MCLCNAPYGAWIKDVDIDVATLLISYLKGHVSKTTSLLSKIQYSHKQGQIIKYEYKENVKKSNDIQRA